MIVSSFHLHSGATFGDLEFACTVAPVWAELYPGEIWGSETSRPPTNMSSSGRHEQNVE
jgi:hypothetical protein